MVRTIGIEPTCPKDFFYREANPPPVQCTHNAILSHYSTAKLLTYLRSCSDAFSTYSVMHKPYPGGVCEIRTRMLTFRLRGLKPIDAIQHPIC